MRFNTTEEISHKAREFWDSGDAWSAGKLVDNHIPMEKRAEWVEGVLDVVTVMFEKEPSIEAVVDFARNPNKFGNGHEGNGKAAHHLVDSVNRFPYHPKAFSQTIFILTAHAGKVVYNAQGFGVPFDYHAALTVFEMAKRMTQEFQDNKFEVNLWSALCPENLLVIEDQPIYPNGWIEGVELSRSKK